jgi:glycosyltransferase involved in cell wall biosynthesis
MHIAFSVVRSITAGGGIEKYTAELGSRLVSRGHRVTVYSMANYGKEPRSHAGMRIVPCPTLPGKFGEKLCAGAVAAARLLTANGIDIAHQHSIAAGAFNWLCAPRRRPTVLQMHGIEWRRTKWGPFARKTVRALERVAVAQYRHVTAVSRTQCRILQERYGIRAVYIPTAADVVPRAECDLIHRDYGLQRGSYVLFASRLVPEKGAHILIDAFKMVRTDRQLVIAGDAPNEPEYVRSLKRQAEADPRIIFPGMVRGRRLQELFSNCCLYVQPSLIEGLSIALLEAMSYGNCCLVSDIDENREAIGCAGMTFLSESPADLADKIATALHSPSLTAELGQAARERVRLTYSWEHVTDLIEELYCSIISGRPFHPAGARVMIAASGVR